jgi:hypothetical protein
METTPQQAFAQAALLEPQVQTPREKVWRVDARSFGGHVNVEDEWEAHIWCRRFACSLQQLRDAVKIKGTSANALRRYFEMKEYGDI